MVESKASPRPGSSPASRSAAGSAVTNRSRLHSLDRDVHSSDGTLIVIAEDTHFRINESMVTRASDNFMLKATITHVLGTDYAEKGWKVVRVSDSAHNLKHVLRILQDGFDYMEHEEGVVKFEYHAAAARLANMYNMTRIADWVLPRLMKLFPAQFERWEATEELRSDCAEVSPEDAIEAVNLFRRLEWNDLLPSAIYVCCQLPIDKLMDGHVRADQFFERLPMAYRKLCITLQKTFVKESTTMSAQLFPDVPCKTCKTSGFFEPETCRKTFSAARQYDRGSLHGDPLGTYLRTKIVKWEREGQVCGECAKELRSRERNMRRSLWERLPSMCKPAADRSRHNTQAQHRLKVSASL